MRCAALEQEKLDAAFSRGIDLPGGKFWPLYYLNRVDEPEFGCEGRPEGGRIFGRAYGVDAQGPRQWDVEESALWRAGLDDGMWVGTWQQGYATLASGTAEPHSLEKALFDEIFTPKP